MSYDIAASFSIDEKIMQMKGNFASSNVYPRRYQKHVWDAPRDYHKDLPSVKMGVLTSEDVFKIGILRDLVGGTIQLASTTSVKYRYALYCLKRLLDEEGFDFWQKSSLVYEKTYTEYTAHETLEHQCSDAEYKELLGQLKRYADLFYELKNSTPEKGEFVVQVNGGYLKKLNKSTYSYCYEVDYAKKYPNRWEAELATVVVHGKVIQL